MRWACASGPQHLAHGSSSCPSSQSPGLRASVPSPHMLGVVLGGQLAGGHQHLRRLRRWAARRPRRLAACMPSPSMHAGAAGSRLRQASLTHLDAHQLVAALLKPLDDVAHQACLSQREAGATTGARAGKAMGRRRLGAQACHRASPAVHPRSPRCTPSGLIMMKDRSAAAPEAANATVEPTARAAGGVGHELSSAASCASHRVCDCRAARRRRQLTGDDGGGGARAGGGRLDQGGQGVVGRLPRRGGGRGWWGMRRGGGGEANASATIGGRRRAAAWRQGRQRCVR